MESSSAADAPPPGRTKKLIPGKGQTSERNEIFASSTGKEVKNKRQLNKFLKSNEGGDTPRRSPRLSKSKPLETPENEPTKKRGRTSRSSKKGKRKDRDDEEAETPDEEKSATARVAGETQTSDVDIKKAEGGREMNEEVANGKALPGGESGNIGTSLNDENEEKIKKITGKMKCLESGNKIDPNTKEEELSTAVKQTATGNQKKEEQIVLSELHVSPGRTKKLIPGKGQTSERNEIFALSTGEEVKNKRQLNKFLKSNEGGDTPRRSPRLSKSKPLETSENEPTKKRGRTSRSSKKGKRKDRDDEEAEAPVEEKSATARVAGETQTSDVDIKKAEGGREMNEEVANGKALPGGESGNIGTSLNDENEEKIKKLTGKMKCLESGNKIDPNTKEEELSTAVKQTATGNQKKEEQIVLSELHVSPGRTKKLNSGKNPTSKRNEIVFILPTGKKTKNKRQLNQFLKSNPGGVTPRRSPRISKSKSLETLEKELAKEPRRNSSSIKEGNRKDNDDEETEASDEEKIATAASKVAEGTQARSDVKMKKAEDGREMNKEVPNEEVLPGGESLDIIVAGSKDENEEYIAKKSRKTKYSEAGNEMDSNTKEDEMNTAEKQTEAENQDEEEKIVLGELHAPPGWTKKLIPEKGHTSKRNEIVFISPTGEKVTNKRQLNQFLESNPGGPASSEFYWGSGDTPICPPRLSESKSLKKRGRKSSSNRSSLSKFRDRISVGSWVHRDFVSRDGQMKLGTHVFFASIDQRSESAGGASACAVLVVIVANWFQTNHDSMPTDSQFDSVIKEGSLEWRNLCAEETIKMRFPNKHLDLETVLQANIRPVSSASEKSFVGFFFPEGMEEGAFEFLNHAMSFDHIWDEISSCAEKNCISGGGPQVYIVSWNDHFFILKVEAEAYYLIDTLGERLYEGCDQAYILKFDKDTTIHRFREEVVKETETVDQLIMAVTEKESDMVPQQKLKEDLIANVESGKKEDSLCTRQQSKKQEDIVCKGKESCKEYIKSFLAAIPLRELQVHIKEREMALEDHLQCLQIEFHYIEFLLPNT